MMIGNNIAAKCYRWIIFGVLCSIYFFAYFYRMSPAVISKDLMSEFNISASAMGILSSIYFYSYAALQIPVGVLSDVVSARKTTAVFTSVASLGAILFGLSSSFSIAILAWLLVGVGVSGVWIPSLKILSRWFKKDEFATLSGVLLAIGNLGAISASYPLAVMVTRLGWRISYIFMGISTSLLVALCWIIVRDSPQTAIKKLEPITMGREESESVNVIDGMKLILKNKYIWLLAIWICIVYGALAAFQGLWGGPYLMDVYKLSKSEAGTILMMVGLGAILGSPVIGILSDKILKTRKQVLEWWSAGFLITWAVSMSYTGTLSIAALYVLYFAIGFFGCCTAMIFTIVKELFPLKITGTATSTVNIFPFIGGATFQVIMGYLLDLTGKVNGVYPVEAYALLFTFLTIIVSIAVIMSLFIKETYGLKQ